MSSAVAFTGAMRIRTGSRKIALARRSIGSGMVAENISVCRCAGSSEMMCFTSGMKPMSNMRSASSKTNTSTWLKSM